MSTPHFKPTGIPVSAARGEAVFLDHCALCHGLHGQADGTGDPLVLARDGMLDPLEIKLTAAPARRQASGIEAFRAAHARLARAR